MGCELWLLGGTYETNKGGIDDGTRLQFRDFKYVDWPEGKAVPPIPKRVGLPLTVKDDGIPIDTASTYQDDPAVSAGTVPYAWSVSNPPIYYLRGDCVPHKSLPPNQPHDCINGSCIPSVSYGTPGKYPNLAACTSGCAKDSPCTDECISTDEIAALQQAVDQLRFSKCK